MNLFRAAAATWSSEFVSTLPIRQVLASWQVCPYRLFCVYMKKIIDATKPNTRVVPSHRSFRRFFRKMFASFLKRQSCNHQAEIQKVITMLQDIGDSIEIIAREIARQIKADE